MTSMSTIQGWIKRGITAGATHIIVVCDNFDYEDYPVLIDPEDDFWKVYDSYNGKNMQRIMEVYDLALPIEDQLSEHRAKHCPPRAVNEVSK